MKTPLFFRVCRLALFLLVAYPLSAQVNLDQGNMSINGVQLLQDSNDPTAYYYLPDYPRLSRDEEGDFELLCVKYVGQNGDDNGGLFHALIQFDLPEDVRADVEKELQKRTGNGVLKGVVPMKQVMKDGEDGIAGFQIVSSVLNNVDGDNAFTNNVITSGHAPLYAGSKAAIAAKLSQEGATLLFESLKGQTSDVSVVVNGYYEAKVKAYNAVVKAEMSTIYEHYSKVYSNQSGYTKRQLRDITDEMVQDQVLEIDVFDRSSGLGIKSDDMADLLGLVTDKLMTLMFDAEMGWAKEPEKEIAVEQGQLLGRRKRGFFSKVFGGARDEKYVTDNQFVLKNREDIRTNKFYMNLSKSTTVKVPVYSSGNLGGLYDVFEDNEALKDKYFQVVNLEDSDFTKREVIFQLDGAYVDSFKDVLNSVSVGFRKEYGDDQEAVTRDIVLSRSLLDKGVDQQSVFFPRLGDTTADWTEFQYRVRWNLKGDDKAIDIPADKDTWLSSKAPSIALSPPFAKRIIQVDTDPQAFSENGVSSCSVRFFTLLNGKAQAQTSVLFRKDDTENSRTITLYYDRDEPIIYQANWYGSQGQTASEPQQLEGDYVFLFPPAPKTATPEPANNEKP